MPNLYEAIADGNVEQVKVLITADPSLVDCGDGENGPLHCAAEANRADMVALLLEHGANINVTDEDGFTALHRACDTQQVDAARVLIEKGADLNVFSPRGETPVFPALLGQNPDGDEIVRLLFEAGAKRGIIDACILADKPRVEQILQANPHALAEVPSHERLLAGIVHVGNYGMIEDRALILDMLFANGFRPDREFVRDHIGYLNASNVTPVIPPLERYLQ